MKQGDYVIRKSYGGDIVFRIEQIVQNTAWLRGVEYRLMADAPLEDLEPVDDPFAASRSGDWEPELKRSIERLQEYRRTALKETIRHLAASAVSPQWQEQGFFEVPGKVLHLDGDANYLAKSMDLYRQLRVPAEGYHMAEADMPDSLRRLLPQVKPDVLVITGHDGVYKRIGDRAPDLYSLSSYKNSRHFVRAIRIAREYERNLDNLIIVAGACQSHFEALLQAGANFASSPGRILIHAMDPVQIASKIAFTSMKETVHISDIIHHTMSGMKGMGGIETRGCFRLGLPNFHKNAN
jgi:spore coat assembly protein